MTPSSTRSTGSTARRGPTWSDVSAFGVTPGCTGALVANTGNPIGGRQAYSGMSPGFPARNQVTLNFGTVLSGLSVQVRFRLGSNAAVSVSGWDIDDVEVSGITTRRSRSRSRSRRRARRAAARSLKAAW